MRSQLFMLALAGALLQTAVAHGRTTASVAGDIGKMRDVSPALERDGILNVSADAGVMVLAEDGSSSGTAHGVGDTVREAAHEVKDAAQDAGHGIKNGAIQVGHHVKKTARQIGHGAKTAATSTGRAVKHAAIRVKDGAKEAGGKAAGATKNAAHKETTTGSGGDK